MNQEQLTLGSLFDGIGGFPYAASFYGIRPLWASEIVPECISVTKNHFPDMEHVGDITKLRGGNLPPVDIITFGSPCQDFSIASSKRLGLAGERSGLFGEAIRIIREMREATHGEYPQFALWENVPGALSSSAGRDFKAVLEAFTETEIPMPGSGRWSNAGMVRGRGVDLAWIVYDAQYFGTAQRRRRIFLIADFRGTRAGKILFVPKSLRGYFEAGGTPRQGLAAFAPDSAGAAGAESARRNVQLIEAAEAMRDQPPMTAVGFDLYQITSQTNRSALKPVQPTLCGAGSPHVVTAPLCIGSGQANAGILEEQSPTLTATHEHPIVTCPQTVGTLCASGTRNEMDFRMVSAGFKHKAGSQAGSVGFREETAPTLMAGQQSAVLKAYGIGAYHSGGMLSDNPRSGFYEADTSRTLDQNGGSPCCNQGGVAVLEGAAVAGYSLNDQYPVHTRLCVRRLTPVEAERLQGYPDGWTEYGADGKRISDTKRYQMLGNSVAVPYVAYIMQGVRDAAGGA